MSYEKFLSPAKIGSLELKNRCIFPPMGTAHVKNSEIGDRTVNYHVRRVRGGCAMNILEISSVHITSSAPGTPGIWDDRFLPGLTRLASAIKEAGGKSCIQLWHGGRQTSGKPYGGPPWAPSAIPCPLIQEMPHAMTTDEIHEVIESYGDAALRAKKAGFDAVELHGAHGYLINCFLNAYSNTRDDEYGGSFENRLRFGLEVIENVRSKVGAGYPLIMRMSLIQHVEGGIQLDDGLKAAQAYEKAGVDAIDVSQGCYGAIPYTVPPYYLPVGVNVELAEAVKKKVKVPVIVAGRITTPELAEEILQSGKADFISLGRVQLADPDFVKKAAEGRSDEIVRCIACDQGCVGRAFAGLGASCMFNPATGDEVNVVITPADVKKKILVIGGGPAGLEAARVAAERGHHVTLFEKTAQPGGQFVIAGSAPLKESFTEAAHHMAYRAEKAGVDIRIYTEATEENIKALNPDEIIIATGSDPLIPKIPGIDGNNVYEARRIMGSNHYVRENNIVVIGGGLVGLEAMEILTCQGKTVTVVEMLDAVGKDMEMYIVPYFMNFLQEHKIEIHTKSTCVKIGEDFVTVEKDGSTTKIPCSAVIVATGGKSNRAVEDVVKATGIPYKIIGDAGKPSKALDAIWGGNAIARAV
jgi:2,4-dienoyl-CoA reductase-like NADH-dependent reductase (Old Yellow Enzyme family)/thioredoxin reductase